MSRGRAALFEGGTVWINPDHTSGPIKVDIIGP